MKCSNCGGELIFENGVGICASCGSTCQIESVFENIDVCLCYIENDKNGRRTKDSIIAGEVYKKLESKKINCFYEHISAGSIVGGDLEVARLSAVANAKIIVLIGTSAENFEELYGKYSEVFGEKTLIPLISDIKPEQLPEKLRCFQVANFDALGALNDLVASILNTLGRGEELELEALYAKRQKFKKIAIIAAAFVALLLCVGVILAFVLGKEDEATVLTNEDIYNQALQLVEDEKYLEAAAEFHKISNYKDSANQFKKIYDRYDGYYLDEAQACSLYLNIVDGNAAELSFEKTVENKIIKIELSALIENNTISAKYTDTLSNEGAISILLGNEMVKLTISTDASNTAVSMGNFTIEFQLKNKTDRPNIKTVTKDVLERWISKRTFIDDIKSEGYNLEYIEVLSEAEPYGYLYTIANTDITLIASNDDVSAFDTFGGYDTPQLEGKAVVAVLVPAELWCPERIGQSSRTYLENNIVCVPNAKGVGIASTDTEERKFFINISITDAYGSQSYTMSCLTIETESVIGITSSAAIGKACYDLLIQENENIYHQTLVFQQHKKDYPDTIYTENSYYIDIHIAAKKNGVLLVYIHENSLDYYYRLDSSSGACSFITSLPAFSNNNSWKNYPEFFGEFLEDGGTVNNDTDESEESETSIDESGETEDIRRLLCDDTLGLYAEPNPESELLAEMPNWSEVTFLSDEGEWAKVQYKGQIGYCLQTHLSKA